MKRILTMNIYKALIFPRVSRITISIIDAEPYSLKNVLKESVKFSDYLKLPTNKLLELIKNKERIYKINK